MNFYWFLIGTLAVWRVTHLLNAEDGPWDLVVRVRSRLGINVWGKLLDCFYCLSLWVAAPVALILGDRGSTRALMWLALSSGAILVERLTARFEARPPAAEYFEDLEAQDHVLWKEENRHRSI